MSLLKSGRATVAALVVLACAVSAITSAARAETRDYEFQLVESEIKSGASAVVSARLVYKPTAKPVADAVVFAQRVDMEPDGMATMTSPIEPLPSEEPGVYRFKTNLSMEGNWRLSLAAKVQGQNGTVQSRMVLKAVP